MGYLRLGVVLAASAFLLPGCDERQAGELRVDKAWVRLPAVAGRPGAAYFTVQGGKEAARLVTIESPQVQTVELHRTIKGAGGAMRMEKLDGVDVPAGQPLEFAPGGYHAMLFGIGPAITPGKTVKLSFRFAKGQPISLDTKVVAAGDPAP